MIRKFDKAGSARWAFVAALLALVLLPSFAGAQSTQDKHRAQREQSLFNLAAGPSSVLQINQYQCGLVNTGDTCTDVFDSPTGGGGFWPTGSANQYMFNSGLQVTGIIPKSAGFAWAGDTTGAFFMDAAGTRKHGTPITDIYNSLDAEDLANWPTPGSVPDFPFVSGIVDDTALFANVLIGRKTASQQDTWVAYWDGDPQKSGGRTHPMGIVVEQRTMAWGYPAGNEASVFFIYRFTNATNNPRFQALNETKYGIQLPDQGWRIDSIYASYDTDPDVGPAATNNYATGIMPFDLGLAYIAQFYETSFIYPTALFHPPFFTGAPGISGFKFLRSPIDPKTGEQVGLTSLSQHTNGGAFPDPATVQQGWRYLSLNVDAGKGDPSCSFDPVEVRARKACYLSQTQSDVRVFIASGPFSLEPGQSATIAVMVFAAATVQVPEITSGPNADNKPGNPTLAPGCNGEPIRPIEKAAGYIGPKAGTCPAPGEKINQHDVNVVPESLLGKALVAQAVFDNKFLLGFAPETPSFYLVPGNNQVSIVWEPSKTDVNGDPFFNAAGDPANPLYDPNYRKFDVEGYRIYRGTTPANLKLIAQFDKAGTLFEDVLCMTDPTHITGAECDASHVATTDIVSPFIQYTNVQELASGDPIVTGADTALAAEIRAGLAKPLTNSGVPFAFVDHEVRNGFQYFYKVTAFDINSVRSGPTSLESAAPSKSVTPREDVANMTLAGQPDLTVQLMGGTTVLNPNAPLPTIDANNGTFSGKMPPTNGLTGEVVPFVARLYGDFTVTATVDSVIASGEGNGDCYNGSSWQGTCWIYYTTFTQGTKKTQSVAYGWSPIWVTGDTDRTQFGLGSTQVPYDPEASAAFGIPATAGANASIAGTFDETIYMSGMEGQKNRRIGGIAGGSRWFSGANETVADPTTFIRVGHLDGVDSIWAPINHTQQSATVTATMSQSTCIQSFFYFSNQAARAADFELTWQGGKVTVKDVTHNVDVPFKRTVQASYGFLNADGDGNGMLDYRDFIYIDRASQDASWRGFCPGFTHDPAKVVYLTDTPQIKPVSFSGDLPTAMTAIGNGIALYINGQIFLFKMNSLPADGTKWNLRMYSGNIIASTGASTADPSGYSFVSKLRPPMVPGLKVVFTGKSAISVAEDFDLTKVHTVPDPYYANSLFDQGPATKELQFVNLPTEATIRIYSMAGVLVNIVTHNDPTGGSIEKWNLRNRSNQFVASGVYFFHVSTPDGKEHVGRFTVVNSGFAR